MSNFKIQGALTPLPPRSDAHACQFCLIDVTFHLHSLLGSPFTTFCLITSGSQGRTQGGVLGLNPPLSLIFFKNFIIRRVYRSWFFTKIRGVWVEECAHYVNKLRLKTWIWRQIVTSQTAHTKYKLPPSATEWKPPHENFLCTPLVVTVHCLMSTTPACY